MRLRSVPPLLLALLCALASVAMLWAADDPGSLYLKVYATYQEGAKLELAGKLDEALQKFRFCVSTLEQFQARYPDYQQSVVDFRLRKSRGAIARIQSLQNAPASPVMGDAFPPESTPAPKTNSPRLQRFSVDDYRVPVAGSPGRVAPVQIVDPADYGNQFTGESVADMKAQIRALRLRLSEVTRTNVDLNNQLSETLGRELSAQKEVDLWRVRSVEQQSQLAQARQSLDDLQQANTRLAGENEFSRRRIEGLEENLKAAQADLDVAGEDKDALFNKLEKAAAFISADEAIRTQLLDERKQLSVRLEEKTQAAAKTEKEREAALAKNDELKKQIVVFEKAGDAGRKLAAAEKRITELSGHEEESRKLENELRVQVEAANKSLAALREDLKSGRQRISELEKQLSDTAGASASAAGAMADENALLKSLVVRQLEDQAKRQQARKLVEEELEKQKIHSGSLLDKFNAMGGAETMLSPQEKKLFDRPVAAAAGHSDFTFQVAKDTPESDLPPELITRASEANTLAQNGRFSEARNIYEEIATKAPQSYLAAVNLGIAQRQLEDYPSAISAFQRALRLKEGDPFALTNLGTAEYRNGDIDDAVVTLKKAVEADSESYLAHYLLGVALKEKGDRAGAQKELQRSLAIKSDYVPAVQLDEELRADAPTVSPISKNPKARP